jgi:hypothetical protein
MSTVLAEILSKYTEDKRNISPTLNSIYECHRISRLDLSHDMITQMTTTPSLIKKYIIACIDKEIELGDEYLTFYTAQSFAKYVSSRVVDYILYDGDDKPSYKFYRGIPPRDATDYSVGGRYSNMEEYIKFIHNYFNNAINEQPSVRQAKLRQYNEILGNPLPEGELTADSFALEQKELIETILRESFIRDDEFVMPESFDKKGTEINKNVYALNNTALGNAFEQQSIGESTIKFLYSKYSDIYNAKNSEKYLKNDIIEFLNIDDSILTKLLSEFNTEMQNFYNTYIGAVETKYKTKNGIIFQISIKKNEIYKYVFPSIGYSIPLRTIIADGEYSTNYRTDINKYYNLISSRDSNKIQLKNSVKNLLDKNFPKLKKFIEKNTPLTNKCEYITEIQSRLVLTDEWIAALNSDARDIVINVFPCNFNDKKEECNDFIAYLDDIIKSFVEKLKKNKTVVGGSSYYNKYLKYKAKYLKLKSNN